MPPKLCITPEQILQRNMYRHITNDRSKNQQKSRSLERRSELPFLSLSLSLSPHRLLFLLPPPMFASLFMTQLSLSLCLFPPKPTPSVEPSFASMAAAAEEEEPPPNNQSGGRRRREDFFFAKNIEPFLQKMYRIH